MSFIINKFLLKKFILKIKLRKKSFTKSKQLNFIKNMHETATEKKTSENLHIKLKKSFIVKITHYFIFV